MSDTSTNQTDTPVTRGLVRVLADSYALYLKTQNYHWNVEGPSFYGLHKMFQEQYEELAEAIDEVAERIRALGAYAPGSFAEFDKLTGVAAPKSRPAAGEMVQDLIDSQAVVVEGAKAALEAAKEVDDEVTIGLLAERMTSHEKTAWMLRSMLV